ncbi:unnamed protein product [Clonostachys solani]|uniref:Uncharacterized protein n=1 Tax=Clonostachys solani TaxID=160281 RepID=A0A9P0EL34_9HYPO|nr:unnamed protein product [Clonostachys solani]
MARYQRICRLQSTACTLLSQILCTPGSKADANLNKERRPDLGYGIIIIVIMLNFPAELSPRFVLHCSSWVRVTSVAKLEIFKMTCKNATIPPTSQI